MIADELCKIEYNKCNNTENRKLSIRNPYSEQQSIYENVIAPMITLTELSARSLKEDVDKEIEKEISKLEEVNPNFSLYEKSGSTIAKFTEHLLTGINDNKSRRR